MQDGRGEVRIVSVTFRLIRAVRIHLEQALREDLTAIVVLPSRVKHTSVIADGRIIRMHLIKRQSPQVPAVPVTRVETADLGIETVHNLDAARRVEDQVAVRQIGTFVIREPQPERQLLKCLVNTNDGH